MNKKSQAAIEFLVTYGWAILAVMIVVASLSYFGVFNTQKYVNDECNFGNQLYCEDFILRGNGLNPRLNISLRNNYDIAITIQSFNVTTKYWPTTVSCGPKDTFLSGSEIEYDCGISGTSAVNIPDGEKVDAKFLIIYSRSGSNIMHNLTGKVKATMIR